MCGIERGFISPYLLKWLKTNGNAMDQYPPKRPHYFFTTAPLPCPYIPGRMERKIVTELSGPDAETLHESLSRAGFRRSHSIAYTPACPNCQACIPVRIVVEGFTPDRTMRKIARRNVGLTATEVSAKATAEQYRLFARYQESRHAGGDMALMGFYDYRSMIEDSTIDSYVVEFRGQDGMLKAAILVDRMSDGLSAVYSFYDPLLPEASLGTYMILWLTEEAERQELPYVYLVYWIAESNKMAYKARFQPLEAYSSEGWLPLDLSAAMVSAEQPAPVEQPAPDTSF